MFRIIYLSISATLFALIPLIVSAQETVPKAVYESAVRVHNSYFQIREMGDYEAAYAMFTDRQKENVS